MLSFGTGATKGEMEFQNITSEVTMGAMSRSIYKMSHDNDGKYYRLVDKFSMPPELDVE